jgi:hypothetical protein
MRRAEIDALFEKLDALPEGETRGEAMQQIMADIAYSQPDLARLVERYAGDADPRATQALSFALASAVAHVRGDQLAPLVLEAAEKLDGEHSRARLNLLSALHLLSTHGELFLRRSAAPRVLPRFFLGCFEQGPEVQAVAVGVVSSLYIEKQLTNFAPDDVAALRKRIKALPRGADVRLDLEIEAFARFLED